MAKLVEIGALVEKHVGEDSFQKIYELDGVEYAFMETGRSNDLFEDRQFGQYGEAAVLTVVVANKFKDSVLKSLAVELGVADSQSGLVYQEKAMRKFEFFSGG